MDNDVSRSEDSSQSQSLGDDASDSESPHSVDGEEAIDIREALYYCLEQSWTNDTSFSFSKTYTAAPNPALHVREVGNIGLPFGKQDARRLRRKARQAPFGQGERTVVDTKVRDTWEVDAHKVEITNPEWSRYLKGVVKEVCKTLGVDYASSKPRCDLYKLFLYEEGSHFLAHVDTEKADGMFATIIIVLPSTFTGGQAHLSFDDSTVVYDCSSTSSFHTTAMAWYTDVTHEIKPVTSGYRLALSYNLIHTTNSLRPALSTRDETTQRLREILEAWSADDSDDPPTKIVYLLAHKYAQMGLRGSSLKGPDAQKVAVLHELAEELDFHLGLASAVCAVEGSANDPYARYSDGYDSYEYDLPNEHRDAQIKFGKIQKVKMSLESLVDLDGTFIQRILELDASRETIPSDLDKVVRDGGHDRQQYRGYMGNAHYRDGTAAPSLSYGLTTVTAPFATGQTQGKPAESLALKAIDFHMSKLVAQTLCAVALARKDRLLWLQAVKMCNPVGGGLAIFDSNDSILEAVSEFGFSKLRSSVDLWYRRGSLESIFHHDQSNARRIHFLDALDIWLHEEGTENQRRRVSLWILSRRQYVARTLRPVVAGDDVLLISLSKRPGVGGVTFIRDSIFPKMKHDTHPSLLRDFAVKVYEEQSFQSESDLRSEVSEAIMTEAISRAAFTPPLMSDLDKFVQDFVSREKTDKKNKGWITAKAFLKACLGRFDGLVENVLAYILSGYDTAPRSDKPVHLVEVLAPALKTVAKYLHNHPTAALPQDLHTYVRAILDLYVQVVIAELAELQLEDVVQRVRTLVVAATVPGGPEVLFKYLQDKHSRLPSLLIRAFIVGLESVANQLNVPEGYNGPALDVVAKDLLKQYSMIAPVTTSAELMDVLDYCLCRRAITSSPYKQILSRVIADNVLTPEYISVVLVPSLSMMRNVAVKYSVTKNFKDTFRSIIFAWMQRNHIPRPPGSVPDRLGTIMRSLLCECKDCDSVRTFFVADTRKEVVLARIGVKRRKHVVEELRSCADNDIFSWEDVETKQKGLRLIKEDAAAKTTQWLMSLEIGRQILCAVSGGEDRDLRRILGRHYETVTQQLEHGTILEEEDEPDDSEDESDDRRSSKRRRTR
ncbi:hypothetical protein EIP91_002847 [Steccherinum ochraceum]|uniref:Uncharacterized protein n=1 Tax=Steccherinum ochraceum TaxID=92696 RepID=A0A4R0RHP7_9APHY|nr:hypothetical protein EIP91_002847 [Steccherinum ochraceum]